MMQKNKLKDMQRGLRESTSFGSGGSWVRGSRSAVKQALRQYNTDPHTEYFVDYPLPWWECNPEDQAVEEFTMIEDERAETQWVNAEGRASMESGWNRRDRQMHVSIRGFERWMLAQDIPFEDRLKWGLKRLPNTRPAMMHARDRMRNDPDWTTTARTGTYWFQLTDEERKVVRFERACEWARLVPMMKFVCCNQLQYRLASECSARYGNRLGLTTSSGFYEYFLCESEEKIVEFLTGSRWDDYGYWRTDNYCRTFLGVLEKLLIEHGVVF